MPALTMVQAHAVVIGGFLYDSQEDLGLPFMLPELTLPWICELVARGHCLKQHTPQQPAFMIVFMIIYMRNAIYETRC